MERIQNMFLDHTGMKLEINTSRELVKFTSMWQLHPTSFLSKQLVKEEITRDIGKYFEIN